MAQLTKKKKRIGVLARAFFWALLLLALAWGAAELLTKQEPVPEEPPQTLHQGQTVTADPKPDKEADTGESGLPLNELDLTAFSRQDGFAIYDVGYTQTGVDVSSHQGQIDWSAVKAAGVEFAMIRVGYRGYTEGGIEEDTLFKENIKGALDAGVQVGVYFFSQAISKVEAVEEAAFVLERIRDYAITYPVIFDWENIEAEARTDGLDQQTITQCAASFCDAVEKAGFRSGVYFNQVFGYQHLNLSQLQEYDFWLAQYDTAPDFRFAFQLWQYTDSGQVDGITGPVDLNLSFVDYGR